MQKTPLDLVARAARIYKSNMDAAKALGITSRSFARICRQFDVETPYVRMRRQRQDARC